MLPFAFVIFPFGLLFGVVATEAGFDFIQTLVFSFTVFAGAAQFTAVAMVNDHAPTLVILLASLGVNLRMAMYSAALVPHFGCLPIFQRILLAYCITDQSFALSERKHIDEPELSPTEKARYFFGGFCFLSPAWLTSVVLGALLGAQIPQEYALDFAMPILFIALFGPMIRSLPHAVAAFVSVLGGLVFITLPFSLGLIVAAIMAIFAAIQTEIWLEQRHD